MKPFKVLACLGVFALVVQLFSDTTQQPPIRGTNTIARQKDFPVEVQLTGQALIMSISQPAPPPLPTNNFARLQWIHEDYYEFQNIDFETILFSRNEPVVTKTKGGWRIRFK